MSASASVTASSSRTARTFRYESYRAVAAGIIETASATFLLLIAVRWFHAGALAKGLVAAGAGLGFLMTPIVVSRVEAARIPVSRAASQLALAGAVAIGLAAIAPLLVIFVPASMIAVAAASAMIPLLTQIYQDNYPERTRGRFFSRTVMIRIVSAAAFAYGGGHLLSWNLGAFRALLAAFCAALLFSSWCLARVPSAPLHVSGGRHPFRALKYAREDQMFRTTLIAWMLMGFANLMMLPLRVEYLANPRYALAMRPDTIALLTGVVPNLARLLMSPVWGWLFDRANFFVLRMSINMGFAIGIASFFTSDSMTGLILAAITFGVSVAGGDVAWALWVTKIAPPERVADYMSVHTFFTGVRGLVAPIVGFVLVAHWSMPAVGWMSAALIVAATLYLLPEVKRGRRLAEVRSAKYEVRSTEVPIEPPAPCRRSS